MSERDDADIVVARHFHDKFCDCAERFIGPAGFDALRAENPTHASSWINCATLARMAAASSGSAPRSEPHT